MADDELKSALAALSWPKGTSVSDSGASWWFGESGASSGNCEGAVVLSDTRRIGGRGLFDWAVYGNIARRYKVDEVFSQEAAFDSEGSVDADEAALQMRGALVRCAEMVKEALDG